MVAYQVLGDGPFDLVCVPGFVGNIEAAWGEPALARHYRRLASFCRLIVFDRRGTGMSDRFEAGAPLTIEERAEEIAAVAAAAGCERPAIFACADGSPVAIFFAATMPKEVRALVLFASTSRYVAAPDYPIGLPPEWFVDLEPHFERRWGNSDRPLDVQRQAPSLLGDRRWYESVARMERLTASPDAAAALWTIHAQTDVRDLLATVQTPTLVLHVSGDQVFPVAQGRYVAEHISDGRFVELNGTDHLYWSQLGDEVADEIEEFLTGVRGGHDTDRALATVLFTDLVSSTERAGELGDRRWHDLLDTHDAAIRREMDRFGGRLVKSLGDGIMAEFTAPGRAIRCALSLRDGLAAIGLTVRAGIHTGEVERRGDDIAGLATHVAARVEAAAEGGEVLVSRTVRDLLAGAAFDWTDRGIHHLKGIHDEWQLYRVEIPSRATPVEASARH
jgi:class 3 adenylate cyclase